MCRPLQFVLRSTLVFGLLVPASLFAQSAPVEVAYVSTDSGVYVYNIDPQTAIPTSLGLAIVVPANPQVVPSANDHFLYITGNNPGSNAEQLWVYATDANGMIPANYLQQINLNTLTSKFSIDPNGTLAYAVQSAPNSQGETVAKIVSFPINATTGLVGTPKIVATYPPNGPCGSGAESASLTLLRFNAAGTKLYDEWFCSFQGSLSATYYTRQVNQQTGALGPDVQTFSWSNTTQGFNNVTFTNNALIDFNVPNHYDQGINSVNVYALSGSPLLFSCTAAMLEACGFALADTVDPSGNYIFLQISEDTTHITKLELGAKQIVDTGSYVSCCVIAFSPDDTVVYTETPNTSNPYVVPIYIFNPATGAVTTSSGAQIDVQEPFFTLAAAVRK
jgi:hypothetical protein